MRENEAIRILCVRVFTDIKDGQFMNVYAQDYRSHGTEELLTILATLGRKKKKKKKRKENKTMIF